MPYGVMHQKHSTKTDFLDLPTSCTTSSVLKTPPPPRSQTSGLRVNDSKTQNIFRFGRLRTIRSDRPLTGVSSKCKISDLNIWRMWASCSCPTTLPRTSTMVYTPPPFDRTSLMDDPYLRLKWLSCAAHLPDPEQPS